MYQYANRVSPQGLHAIASQLYVEMLKGGYTSVAEFHYLHHQPDGTRYANRSQLSQSIIDAANLSGIGMALHSLRAVTPEAIDQALGHFIHAHPQRPIHIHVAEQ